ncbi:MAG: AAA family ATPase [Planctomycetia bacterium]|nr:AAA family ATPase [Planctomycetia bacterium]
MTGPSFASPTAPTAPAAKPAPARSAPRPGEKPDDGMGLRVVTYLRLHWLMILFCGTLLGAVGAFAAWELLASKYESYALLQASSAHTSIGAQNNPHQARTDFATYVKTTAALLKSEFVLNAALRDIKDLPTIKAQKDPIKYLDEELLVTWQDGSEVIRITFKGNEPQDAKKIVDAVQKAFMAEVIEKDLREKRDFLKKVEDAQLEMRRILGKFGNKLEVKPAGGATPPGPGAPPDAENPPAPLPPIAPGVAGPSVPPVPGMSSSDVVNRLNPSILINKLAALQQEIERLPLTIRDYQRRHDVLKAKLKTLQDAPISKGTLELVEKDQDVVLQQIRVNDAKRKYDFYKNGGDEKAPKVVEFREVWELHTKRLDELKKEKANTIEGQVRLGEARKLAEELEGVIRSIQRYQEQLDTAKMLLGRAEKQLNELPLPTDRNGGLIPVNFNEKDLYRPENSDLESTDGIYRQLVRQYYQTQMELNSPTRVRILQPASQPTQRDMKKQVLGTAFAGIMGFVLIALGVVAYETMTKRVSSLADVKTSVPSPIVGVIPVQPGDGTRDSAKLAATNEAIDKLRAYVSQTWLSRGATTIAVTSTIGDEGKTFTAFGLASSLAQAGYKTLLVDFDLRDPSLHQLAGVANLAGVCELLRGETDLRSSVQFLPSGLHLLSAGKWSDEARKASTGEKLQSVLAKMKEPYDCVVLHGHALLTVAESVEVARRCEVVLVCARYRETATPMLKRAADRVTAMEIPYSGIVYVGASEQEALC